jgi:hypothetical protein
LNFFVNRSTNASAESFNAKIKEFRANLNPTCQFLPLKIAKNSQNWLDEKFQQKEIQSITKM